MKCFFWNARGLANQPTRLALKKVFVIHKPDFIFVVNHGCWKVTSLHPFGEDWTWKSLQSNPWCICSAYLNPDIISLIDQQVSFSVMVEDHKICISIVYASTSCLLRRRLWHDLNLLQQNHPFPWCFVGDFNVVLGAHEYRGKGVSLQVASDDFRHWSDSNALTHLLTRCAFYTWSNGRRGGNFTEKRHDRVVCNDG